MRAARLLRNGSTVTQMEISARGDKPREQNRVKAVLLTVLVVLPLAGTGCGIKRTVTVAVPARILQAKTASFQELVALIDDYAGKVQTLSSQTMRVTFTSGKLESGKLQEYRSAPGYVLLRRPDSIRLSIQNPITKTSIADLVSSGDDFSAWFPTENKFFEGKNSMREFAVEGKSSQLSFSARPIHIFEAILPPKISVGEPGYHIALEEAQDAATKYYVLTLYRDGPENRLIPVRRYWIDRADMTIARFQTFEGNGEISGTVGYSRITPEEGVALPLTIKIDRPIDGYSLDMEFKSWRINPSIPDNAFVLTPPAGAERIQLKEKPVARSRTDGSL
jgi:outer membrane lipoprotein-sorting protein